MRHKIKQHITCKNSSGNTLSVLHIDPYEIINCNFDGTKEFILIDRRYLKAMQQVELGMRFNHGTKQNVSFFFKCEFAKKKKNVQKN